MKRSKQKRSYSTDKPAGRTYANVWNCAAEMSKVSRGPRTPILLGDEIRTASLLADVTSMLFLAPERTAL